MSACTRRLVSAVAVLSCSAVAFAADPTIEELQARINVLEKKAQTVDALQKKVEDLEAKQVSSADVDATVQRVLEDAQKRSQLMSDEGFTAGYTKGRFTIQSADGNFVWSPIAQFQFRYIANYTDNAASTADGVGNTDDGFEVRRAKIGFQGNIFSPELTYKFLWASSRGNNMAATSSNPAAGETLLEEAWMRYQFNKEVAAFVGEYKDIVGKDAMVSATRAMAVEETVATQLLYDNTTNYIQGIGVTYQPVNVVRVTGIYHDGVNSTDTNFQDETNTVWGVPTTEFFGVSGRAEWMIMGDTWSQYDQFTALGSKADMLVLGGGFDYTQGSAVDATFEAVDLMYQSAAAPGLSAFVSAIGNEINPDATANSFNYGFIGQVAWLFHNNWEVFGRYDISIFDNDALHLNGDNEVQEITAGVNYYLSGHAAKLTFDVVYLPQGFPSSIAAFTGGLTGSGILPTNGSSEEVVARVQFQLLL